MPTLTSQSGKFVVVRINSGEDILDKIEEAVREHNIRNGLLLGAIGSVRSYHVHVVNSLNVPPGDDFLKGEEPLDILGLNGVIMGGRVHAHISFSGLKQTFGGHLEPGCRILSFCQVYLVETPDADLTDWDRIGHIG